MFAIAIHTGVLYHIFCLIFVVAWFYRDVNEKSVEYAWNVQSWLRDNDLLSC